MTRPTLRPDGIPARACVEYLTPAEVAIQHAVYAVEESGASRALTDAVVLLDRARHRVADHVEGIPDPELGLDLRASGLLWLINATVFHPRGFALAIDTETGAFSLLGNGCEPWFFNLPAEEMDAIYDAANETLRRRA